METITQAEIRQSIVDPTWQAFRISMHRLTTRQKLDRCTDWLTMKFYSRTAVVQTTNYINALKRAGLVALDGKTVLRG